MLFSGQVVMHTYPRVHTTQVVASWRLGEGGDER